MTRSRFWLYGGWVLIALLTAVALALIVGHETDACTLPMMLDEHQRPTTWCWEFWLNRYQTLVGAIVAIAAALVTWIAIQRQTRSNWEGTQLQLLSARRHRWREERVLVRALRLAAVDLSTESASLKLHLGREIKADTFAGFDIQEKFAEIERKSEIFRAQWSNVLIEDHLVSKVVNLVQSVWRLKASFALAMLDARKISSKFIFEDMLSEAQQAEWETSGQDTRERLLAAYERFQASFRALTSACEMEIDRLTTLIARTPDEI